MVTWLRKRNHVSVVQFDADVVEVFEETQQIDRRIGLEVKLAAHVLRNLLQSFVAVPLVRPHSGQSVTHWLRRAPFVKMPWISRS